MADLIDRDALLKEAEIAPMYAVDAMVCYGLIKSAPAVNRWISVHDMLPAEGMDVLICNFDEWCKIASYHGNHWEDVHGRCVPEYEITHWQELPELPKEGADNEN